MRDHAIPVKIHEIYAVVLATVKSGFFEITQIPFALEGKVRSEQIETWVF